MTNLYCPNLNRFYHLDGRGQLAHLDSILKIKNLTGVQWVPGAGSPDESCWPQVYQKIHAAGKRIHVGGGFSAIDAIARQIGTPAGIVQHIFSHPKEEEPAVRKQLANYGIE